MDNASRAMCITILLYTCMHYLVRALVMICLGLITNSIIPVLGVVGYVMALYYLLKSADAVRDSSNKIEPEEMVKILEEKIEALAKDKTP